MDVVEVLPLTDAAVVLGRTSQGLRQRRKRGTLLTEGEGPNPNVLVVDGELVERLADAAELLRSLGRGVAQLQSTQDELDRVQAEKRDVEEQLQIARHALEMEKSRSVSDVAALAESLETAARLIRDRATRD